MDFFFYKTPLKIISTYQNDFDGTQQMQTYMYIHSDTRDYFQMPDILQIDIIKTVLTIFIKTLLHISDFINNFTQVTK